jgi:hypothetical protein
VAAFRVDPSLSQLDKATADAAEFKAGYDKAIYDNFEQKAQVRGWAGRGWAAGAAVEEGPAP